MKHKQPKKKKKRAPREERRPPTDPDRQQLDYEFWLETHYRPGIPED